MKEEIFVEIFSAFTFHTGLALSKRRLTGPSERNKHKCLDFALAINTSLVFVHYLSCVVSYIALI